MEVATGETGLSGAAVGERSEALPFAMTEPIFLRILMEEVIEDLNDSFGYEL
jgi:hypothetical protein